MTIAVALLVGIIIIFMIYGMLALSKHDAEKKQNIQKSIKNKVLNDYYNPKSEAPEPFSTENTGTESTVVYGLDFIGLNLHSKMTKEEWDEARNALQRVAYSMVNAASDEKEKFTKFMAEFAKLDPLYKDVIAVIKPVIRQNKGILQSKIYPYAPNYDQETIRYVLYFAHEIGDIMRIKKGRSYELYISEIINQ